MKHDRFPAERVFLDPVHLLSKGYMSDVGRTLQTSYIPTHHDKTVMDGAPEQSSPRQVFSS
jgi:hypothetical protein